MCSRELLASVAGMCEQIVFSAVTGTLEPARLSLVIATRTYLAQVAPSVYQSSCIASAPSTIFANCPSKKC